MVSTAPAFGKDREFIVDTALLSGNEGLADGAVASDHDVEAVVWPVGRDALKVVVDYRYG